MNMKKLFLCIATLLFVCGTMQAQKPLVGSWFADDVMNWSAETDPDARFNKSTIPLQPRFEDTSLLANPYQQYTGKVCNSTIMWNRCGSQPAQGAFDFAAYSFTHWQYIDMLVYWAGAASEGLICPPAATWTDAAHANGVLMIGQIFLNGAWGCGPESAKICSAINSKDENGRSLFAKKLYEITAYYGFDGWFINEEYGGGCDYGQFFEDYYWFAAQAGDTHQHMQWYSATGSPSRGIVDRDPRTSQFLEYGAQYHCSDSEFMKYFSGMQVVHNGLGGYGNLYRNLFNKDGHTGSVDLFCPEERIWKDKLKNNGVDCENYDSPTRRGVKAYTAQGQIFEDEANYFVNRKHDPSDNSAYESSGDWPGFSTTLAERSTITTKAFFSAFGNGLGKHHFVNGKKEGTNDWCHVGMQDILPTWRWWIETAGEKVTIQQDWDDAYQFGSSYKVTGKLVANVPQTVRLYKTQLAIASGDKLQFVYKTNTAGSLTIQVGTKESNHTLADLPAPTTIEENGWTVANYDLSSLVGNTMSVIALKISSTATVDAYTASLGQLLVSDGDASVLGKVQNLTMQNKMGVEEGDIRLYWDAPASGAEKVHHYDLYMNRNGVRTLAGQTKNCAFYFAKITREGLNDAGPAIEVVPVSYNQVAGESALMTESQFAQPTSPKVFVETSKSLVAPGTTVTFKAVADSIQNVIGADEFAPNVDDNAFTNGAAKTALYNACKAAKVLQLNYPDAWKEVADGLVFAQMQDGTTKEHAHYQGEVIKQADVNLLAYPLEIITDKQQIKKDLVYYEPKIYKDGPAMGNSILSILYASLGNKKKAYALFKKSYMPNKRPPFGVLSESAFSNNPYFATGAGGLLQVVLNGFGGLRITDSGVVQKEVLLPDKWKSLTIKGVGPDKKSFVVSRE